MGKGAPPLMKGSPTFADTQSMPTMEELGEWMPLADERSDEKLHGAKDRARTLA